MSAFHDSKRQRTLSEEEQIVRSFSFSNDASKVARLLRDNGGRGDEVAEAARRAVSRLAFCDYDDKLDDCERYELVVDMLRAFGTTNEKVAEEGCWGLGNFAFYDDSAKKIGERGGCRVVVDALGAFGTRNQHIALYGCFAVKNLARYEENTKKLGDCGGCQCVVDAMRAFGTTDENLAETGCWAVARLATNVDNRTKLNSLGAVDVVRSSLENDKKHQALSMLCWIAT